MAVTSDDTPPSAPIYSSPLPIAPWILKTTTPADGAVQCIQQGFFTGDSLSAAGAEAGTISTEFVISRGTAVELWAAASPRGRVVGGWSGSPPIGAPTHDKVVRVAWQPVFGSVLDLKTLPASRWHAEVGQGVWDRPVR